jgi:hypothetical protein
MSASPLKADIRASGQQVRKGHLLKSSFDQMETPAHFLFNARPSRDD